MKPRIINVAGCKSCPFCSNISFGNFRTPGKVSVGCQHPHVFGVYSFQEPETSPESCPLTEQSLVIQKV